MNLAGFRQSQMTRYFDKQAVDDLHSIVTTHEIVFNGTWTVALPRPQPVGLSHRVMRQNCYLIE